MTVLYTDPRRDSGCDYHRTQLPLQHIGVIRPRVPTLFVNRDTSWSIARIRAHKANGGRFVYDQDDSVDLPVGHPLYAHYAKPAVRERIQALFDLADVVTVTTKRLADEFRHMTDSPIEVLPNALPYDEGQFTLSTDRETSRLICWAGGSSHEVDLALVRGVIDGRQLCLSGYQRVPAWFNMVQMFPGVMVKPAAGVRSYMHLYDGHQFAIAPLASSPFAECKSNLKILEAGAKGLPIICSRTLPYDTPDMRRVVRFADSYIDWMGHKNVLLKDPQRAAYEGARLAEHVRKHYNLKTVNEHRRQILEG